MRLGANSLWEEKAAGIHRDKHVKFFHLKLRQSTYKYIYIYGAIRNNHFTIE